MKVLALVLAAMAVAAHASPQAAPAAKRAPKQETAETPQAAGAKRPEYNVRNLIADQLRDFPGLCFGSTTFRFYRMGESWPLSPFCGMATCLTDHVNLLEQVTECRIPKENPKCKVINLTDREKQFPDCCPQFECEEGAVLEYPTPEELQLLAQQAQEHQLMAAALQHQQVQLQQQQHQLQMQGLGLGPRGPVGLSKAAAGLLQQNAQRS